MNTRLILLYSIIAGCLGGPLASGQTMHVPGGSVGNIGGSNVGIGTTSPQASLHVVGSVVSDSSTYPGFYAYNGTSPVAAVQIDIASSFMNVGDLYGAAPSLALRFFTADAERLRIDTSGNVGIGTTTPARRLEVIKDLGVSAGEKFIANLTRSPGQNGLFLGYRGNGTSVSSALIRADNNLPITFGTSQHNEAVHIGNDGNVGIGTTTPSHKLAVYGTVRAREVIVDDSGWADHVFSEDYRLAPLEEVEAHILKKKHLPGVPTAADVRERGISIGEMQVKLLEKIEELTLHLIEQRRRDRAQQDEIATLRREIARLSNEGSR